jgi:hypothetical protein
VNTSFWQPSEFALFTPCLAPQCIALSINWFKISMLPELSVPKFPPDQRYQILPALLKMGLSYPGSFRAKPVTLHYNRISPTTHRPTKLPKWRAKVSSLCASIHHHSLMAHFMYYVIDGSQLPERVILYQNV